MLHILKQFILDKFSSRTRQLGFTMIEMMVVIVIIGIVAATSVSVFQSQKNSKSVEVVAKEIRNKMMQAHAEAMSPPSNLRELKSIKITFDCTPSPCKIKKIYNSFFGTSETIYTVPKNIQASMNPAGTNFEFIANSGSKMGQISSGVDQSFIISNKDNTIKYQVQIDWMTGNVTLKKI